MNGGMYDVIDGSKLFKRDRQGRRVGGLALYVRMCFDYLQLDEDDDRIDCFGARIRGKTNKTDILVGFCYQPPKQDKEAEELLCRQLGQVSPSLALVLMGDFNLPGVYWKCNTAEESV